MRIWRLGRVVIKGVIEVGATEIDLEVVDSGRALKVESRILNELVSLNWVCQGSIGAWLGRNPVIHHYNSDIYPNHSCKLLGILEWWLASIA